MRLTQIDLNLFVVFDAIHSEGNLTRAAESLSVTQPAVSNALARLRAALGDPLFVRSPRGMVPTPHAESIAGAVAEALHLLSGAAQRGAGFDPARSNRVFRLSMPDLFDALLLAPLAADTATHAPGIGLHNFRLPRSEIRGALARGTLDVAAEVALPDSTGLIRAPLLGEPHVCALRPGHPALEGEMTLGRYLDLDHIHVSGRKRGPGVVDLALRALGVQRRIRIRLQHYLAVGDLALGSDLAVSLPRSWARTLGLTARPLPFEVPQMETFLYRHIRSDGDAAVCWLFDRILARPVTPEP
jgi:DNA-binding transcriptional LysR family regulator